jgi:glycine/D-amino acid oxidase-like deaminating enzyme
VRAATKYGVSYWDARTPRAKRPSLPRHRGHLDTEVAIIGGGLAGCATAYVFAASGISVALFEEGRLAGGATGASSGLLLQSPDTSFGELADLHGVKTARQIYQATRRASLDLAATLRRLGIRSDLIVGTSLMLARSEDEARRLRRELTARRDAGLEAAWVNARRLQADAALEGTGAIASRGDALVDPVRTALGLARAATARGAQIFERSAVARVRPARKWIDLKTDGGTVRASVAIVATGGPSDGFDPLERHFRRLHTYHVVTEPLPAAVRRETGHLHAVVRDSARPPHCLGWLRDDRVLFGGADQPALADRARPKAIVQRTGELMYELSRLYPAISGLRPSFGWDAAYARTADGIPFIGPHRNYPRHLFALGCPPGGLAQAFLAARILLRAHTGTPDAGDHAFAFTRLIG